jgi:UDP-GlcNAc:undecaprenyl-phosphate/decaprenyl-phosphate GlcNAc-1-phosphate transferase
MSELAVLVAFPTAAAVIWLTLRTRLARRLVAEPTGERWSEKATPSFGGLGIAAGLAAGVLLALAVGAIDPSSELWGILGGCALLFLAGAVDDLRALPPFVKLAAQLGAAALALAGGLSVEIVDNDVLAVAIAVVWLVGMTNAFNLLDNMDGLAASLAAIAAAYFAIDAATVHPNDTVLVLALSLGLACAGFLPFNIRPGRPAAIFMGDSGSQLLGFALAALGLYASWNVAGTTVATLLLPILVLAVPILDTALVTVIRLLEGRPLSQGGRDHTSHRIVYRGISERRAVLLLALVSAALGATSLAYTVLDDAWIAAIGVLVTFSLLVQFASFIAEVERGSEPASFVARTLVVHRKRLVEVAVDAGLITASLAAAFLLRVDGTGTAYQRHIVAASLPPILAARYLAFIPLGLYRGVWRYASAGDALRVVLAVGISQLLAVGYVALTNSFGDFPVDVYLIDALLCCILIGGSRFGERAFAKGLHTLWGRDRRRTLIVGAGRAGRSLLRELRELPSERVVGFVDDDPRLRGRTLLGTRVVGGTDELPTILAAVGPERVLVTIPDAPHLLLEAVVGACADAGVACRFVRREIDLDPTAVLGAAVK